MIAHPEKCTLPCEPEHRRIVAARAGVSPETLEAAYTAAVQGTHAGEPWFPFAPGRRADPCRYFPGCVQLAWAALQPRILTGPDTLPALLADVRDYTTCFERRVANGIPFSRDERFRLSGWDLPQFRDGVPVQPLPPPIEPGEPRRAAEPVHTAPEPEPEPGAEIPDGSHTPEPRPFVPTPATRPETGPRAVKRPAAPKPPAKPKPAPRMPTPEETLGGLF